MLLETCADAWGVREGTAALLPYTHAWRAGKAAFFVINLS